MQRCRCAQGPLWPNLSKHSLNSSLPYRTTGLSDGGLRFSSAEAPERGGRATKSEDDECADCKPPQQLGHAAARHSRSGKSRRGDVRDGVVSGDHRSAESARRNFSDAARALIRPHEAAGASGSQVLSSRFSAAGAWQRDYQATPKFASPSDDGCILPVPVQKIYESKT